MILELIFRQFVDEMDAKVLLRHINVLPCNLLRICNDALLIFLAYAASTILYSVSFFNVALVGYKLCFG